jgi:hypothetical protein
MAGVFNIVDSLRGGGHLAPILQGRTALYDLFRRRHGRPPIAEESDRLDTALDGLLLPHVGFEHVIHEDDNWSNINFIFEDGEGATAITLAEYGIDAVVAAQHTQRRPVANDSPIKELSVVERWIDRAYFLAMGNRDDEDVMWMAKRYEQEPRPRGNAFDIALGTHDANMYADVVVDLPSREIRTADTRRSNRNIYFSDINPLTAPADPMSPALSNI